MRRYACGVVTLAVFILAGGCENTEQATPIEKIPGTHLFVSTDGNDAWSGRLAAPNDAKTDGPFATIEGARNAIRSLSIPNQHSKIQNGFTVFVRGGTYELKQTLRLTAEDSGTESALVVYRAYPGETPTLTGGRGVAGWRKHSGGVCVTSPAEQGFDDFRFREIFHKGERQVLARFPNCDPAHPVTGGLLYVDETAALARNRFHYRPGSIPFEQWKDLSQAEVNIFPYHCWDHNIIRVAKAEPEACLVTLRHNVAGSIFIGNRYFLQNVFEMLDAPGEWFSDWTTGKLYFYPPSGGVPRDGEVVVPVLENLVEFSGTEQAPVRHIRFHGFRLSHARQDAIALEGAQDCSVTGNTITQVDGVGVNVGYLRNAMKGVGLPWRKPGAVTVNAHSGDRRLFFSHPGRGCRVAGNDIFSIGGDGIVLGGEKNTADNNHVYRTGLYDMVCAGVTIYGDGNVASHNAIHDVPRDGIFINGKLNVAEYNDIRNSMLYTADNAAIALRQHDVSQAVKNRGNVLRFNRLLDTIGYGSYPHCQHPGKGFGSPFCSFGIYLDGSICGVTVYGNIVSRCGATSVFIQFGGGNVLENNIFVEGDAGRLQYDSMIYFGTFMFSDKQKQYDEPPNEIKRNIFCYAQPDTKLYRVGHWDNAPEWNRKQAVFDDNLIWHNGLPISLCMHKKMDYGSLDEWQAQGYDTRSVTADPMFVDPKKDDYRLKPDSPAYKTGFKNINAEIEKIGAYRSEERASWPLRNAVLRRETPVVFEFPKEPRPLVDGFETTPVAFPPAKAQVSSGGTIQVSTDAARTGSRSLKLTDAPGLKNAWEPHMYYRTEYLSGKVHFSMDLMNSKDSPADLYVEFRDWEKELSVGPTFRLTREGKLCANGPFGGGGREVGTTPNGEWFRVSMDFQLGDNAPREYLLTLSVPGKKDVTATFPFPQDGFKKVTWLGISSTSTDKAVFYVDNIILGPPDSEKVKNAADCIAIKGTGKAESAPKAPQDTPEKPAGYWKLDDDAIDLMDSSGNGLHGDQGGALRAKGAFGKALYLDGGGAATIPDSFLLQFGTGDFSIECWLCPVSLAVPSEHKRRRVIEKSACPATWWNIDLHCDGKIRMEMTDENKNGGTTVSSGAIPEKKWTHLAIVVDRKNFKTLFYLNGKLDSAQDIPKGFTGALSVPGRPLSTGTWQPYNGLISELKIYRRLLREDEIKADYEKGKARFVSEAFTVISED